MGKSAPASNNLERSHLEFDMPSLGSQHPTVGAGADLVDHGRLQVDHSESRSNLHYMTVLSLYNTASHTSTQEDTSKQLATRATWKSHYGPRHAAGHMLASTGPKWPVFEFALTTCWPRTFRSWLRALLVNLMIFGSGTALGSLAH